MALGKHREHVRKPCAGSVIVKPSQLLMPVSRGSLIIAEVVPNASSLEGLPFVARTRALRGPCAPARERSGKGRAPRRAAPRPARAGLKTYRKSSSAKPPGARSGETSSAPLVNRVSYETIGIHRTITSEAHDNILGD